MKTLFCFFKLLMVAAVTMIAVFLLSLPFFYFALTWENGIHSILLEDLFIGALAVAGFFCYRWLNRIFRDSGSGDLYLWSAILIVMIILFAFRDHSSYAVSLGRKIFPEGVLYKEMLVLDGGTIGENLVHLMKFSSLYITTYTAAFCFLMAVFGRCLWNQKMPEYLTKLKLDFYEWSDRVRDGKSKNSGYNGERKKDDGYGCFRFYPGFSREHGGKDKYAEIDGGNGRQSERKWKNKS